MSDTEPTHIAESVSTTWPSCRACGCALTAHYSNAWPTPPPYYTCPNTACPTRHSDGCQEGS